MPETVESLEGIKTLSTGSATPGSATGSNAAVIGVRKVDKLGRSYGTGRRKTATARVWLKPGSGKITINGKDIETYFARAVLRMMLRAPLEVAKRETELDVVCTVAGSGLSGQAGAIRHGIARALVNYEPETRPLMKPNSYLTRDPRAVERKKYGRAKARRSFQFSKR